MSFSNFAADPSVTAAAIPIACRKRKDLDESDEYEPSTFDRSHGIKGLRRSFPTVESSQEAQFHPLPRDLNLQLLSNMGYDFTDQQQQQQHIFDTSRHNSNSSYSPCSTASDVYPSTPSDMVAGPEESYFSKDMHSELAPEIFTAYPNFNIYPDLVRNLNNYNDHEREHPLASGLLGMDMRQTSSPSIDSTGDGMDVDGETQNQAGPSHG
jgi:hypothetical protein